MYSIIKNEQVLSGVEKEIETDFQIRKVDSYAEFKENSAKTYIDSYENLARTMLENSRRQADEIISKAYDDIRKMGEDAKVVRENAMKKAEEEGFNKGYNDGLQNFQEKSREMMASEIQKANTSREKIINEALATLNSAKQEYCKYIDEKQQSIKTVILNFCKQILKKESINNDFLDELVFDLLSKARNSKVFIIRCNERYLEELNSKIIDFKKQLAYKGDIFVIKDDSIEQGNVTIEKNNGKIQAGIDVALEELKQIIDRID